MSLFLSEDGNIDIPFYRHLAHTNFTEFAKELKTLDPEITKIILGHIPEFADCAKSSVTAYTKIYESTLANNSLSVSLYYENCRIIIDAISDLLKNDDLSFDEQIIIMDKLLELEERMAAKDSENKHFIRKEAHKTRRSIWKSIGILCTGFAIGLIGGIGISSKGETSKN